MDKAKRKGQPVNLKRYWLRYSLLAIVLLIPFRIINEPAITLIVYVAALGAVIILLANLMMREYVRLRLYSIVVLCICMMICINQIRVINTEMQYAFSHIVDEFDNAYRTCSKQYLYGKAIDASWGIFEPISCDWYLCSHTFVGIKNTTIYIDAMILPESSDWTFCG